MRRTLAWLAVVCLAATTQPARSAEPAKATAAPSASGDPLPIHDGVLELSLEEAVRLGIQRNLDVELLRFDPLIAEKDYGAAWGAYDPQIFGDGGFERTARPTASQILGTEILEDETWSGRSGLQGLIPWLGGSYQAGYHGSELNTNSRIAQLSPEYRAGFFGSVTMPLLKGLFWSDSWTQVRLARIGVDLTDERFRQDLMDVVARIEDGYWGLIAAQEEREVAEKSLETANALLEQTQAQFEVGVVSKVEVVQAEAGVADREFKLITAEAVERNSQDRLIDGVLGPYLEPDTDLRVVATDRPEEITVREVSAAAATEHAMARRPELEVARKDIERRQVEKKKAGNDRLPQLDVTGSYGKSGLAGRLSSDCISFVTGGQCSELTRAPPTEWINANDRLFRGSTGGKGSGEDYAIQGVLSIPLGNNTARNLYQKADLELRRAETSLHRLEQSIISDIRRAARDLRSALEGIDAAARAEAAAAEQLRAERTRLEYGESTPFDVLLREEDLVRAQAQKIAAQRVYHNSITALDRAQGTILERHQIAVEEAETLR